MTVRLGRDGYPVPHTTKPKSSFSCVCPICMGADSTISVTKTGNWIVRCPSCCIVMYLNDVMSINLFRGLQKFLDEEPEHQVRHTSGILRHAPDEGQ